MEVIATISILRTDVMDSHHLPPKVLFRSFLIVAGAYLASITSMFVMAAVVIQAFFPETFEFLSTPDLPEDQLFANPDLVMPDNLFWILLIGQSCVCWALGWLVTRFSAFAKFNHAIFVAVVVFVSFLQIAVKTPSELQWKFLIMMAAFPIAILIGAKMQGGAKSGS